MGDLCRVTKEETKKLKKIKNEIIETEKKRVKWITHTHIQNNEQDSIQNKH